MTVLSRWTDLRTAGQCLAALSWRDRRRLLLLAVLLPAIDLLLRRHGLRGAQAWLARWRGNALPHASTPAELADAERLAELAAIAGRRGLYANTCLRQALAVQWWLQRRGLPAQLRIGAQPAGTSLDAHAWVKLDGVALAQTRTLPPVFDSTDTNTNARHHR
jgi:hypothetical protein